MDEDQKPRRTRQEVLATNPRARTFQEAGGYAALDALHVAAIASGLSYVAIVQEFREEDPDDMRSHVCGRAVLDDASLEIQVAAMACESRFEDVVAGLVSIFGVPIDGAGDVAAVLGVEGLAQGQEAPLADDVTP